MSSKKQLIRKRDALINQLSQFSDAVSGNLSKSAVPPHSSNHYWRITWKEKQKTRIQYVRPAELDRFSAGIKQFSRLKNAVNTLGDINRAIILAERGKE
jgi:hypothetical protein